MIVWKNCHISIPVTYSLFMNWYSRSLKNFQFLLSGRCGNKIGEYFLAASFCTRAKPIGPTLLRASLVFSFEYVSISKTQKMVSCMEFPHYVSYLAIRKPTVISWMFYWQTDIYLQSIVTALNCVLSLKEIQHLTLEFSSRETYLDAKILSTATDRNSFCYLCSAKRT